MTRQPLDIRIHDASIGIWQERSGDASFRSEVFGPLIRSLRARGWSLKDDPHVRLHCRSISANRRLGARGSLRCTIEISGRVVNVEFWSTTAPQLNGNGRRYDFDKLARMPYLDRLRVELEFKRIAGWAGTLAPVSLLRSDESRLSPIRRIEKNYAESWHKDKVLGRPHCDYDYNRKSGDGALLEHAQAVWLPDRKGRIIRGTAYYNINNMWWVIAGGCLLNEGSHCLLASQPADLRRKRNECSRRTRLESELSLAVERMDFARAQLLKSVLFGDEQTFLIYARDHDAYYRAQYSGYTKDRINAGKYTRAEAEAECRRVPHELEMVCPDGARVSFARAA